jgi:hypothetical protein
MAKEGQQYPIFYLQMTIFFQRGDAKNLQALNEAVQTYNEGLGQRINSKVFFFLW